MKDSKIIFEKANSSLSAFTFNREKSDDEIMKYIPGSMQREGLGIIKDSSENEVARHFIELSSLNFGVDSGFYPLGSCTMKYNPKINEKISKAAPFTSFHPYSAEERVQGNLEVLYKCKEDLMEIVGMDDIDFSPCAGAHGELAGLYIIRAYFAAKGEERPYILIPDSAHGTNPASASMAGYKVITVKSDAEGFVDIEDLKAKANGEVASFMLTNPNTLGIYEKNIREIVKICHEKDIQLYYDGANLNAILGISRPGDTGFDVVHLNLHKTFSTPHGGGGPGSGPVGVKKHLQQFLPGVEVSRNNDKYSIADRGGPSLGKIRTFYSNFLVVLRAYVYIKQLGSDGLRMSGLLALLNANYLAKLLDEHFEIKTEHHVMHEFVISLTNLLKSNEKGVKLTVIDFAKRILDYHFHAPTVSFPLIVPDCLMIEPTETESKETLEKFAAVLIEIAKEAVESPEALVEAPVKAPVGRVDEVSAARKPVIRYSFSEDS